MIGRLGYYYTLTIIIFITILYLIRILKIYAVETRGAYHHRRPNYPFFPIPTPPSPPKTQATIAHHQSRHRYKYWLIKFLRIRTGDHAKRLAAKPGITLSGWRKDGQQYYIWRPTLRIYNCGQNMKRVMYCTVYEIFIISEIINTRNTKS